MTTDEALRPDQVTFAVLDDADGAETTSLLTWLRDEGLPAGCRVDARHAGPRDGEMSGGAWELIEAAVLNKDVFVALVGAAGGWVAARAGERRTRIRVKRGDKETIIDSMRIKDPESIARRIARDLSEED